MAIKKLFNLSKHVGEDRQQYLNYVVHNINASKINIIKITINKNADANKSFVGSEEQLSIKLPSDKRF
jgi:hypothetical protein